MKRIHIELLARWGNDDAESRIRISRRRWSAIQNGEAYEVRATSTYEGKRYPGVGRFAQGQGSIDGEQGLECVADLPVTALIAPTVPMDAAPAVIRAMAVFLIPWPSLTICSVSGSS